MRDLGRGLRKERHLLGHFARAREHRVRDKRADAKAVRARGNRGELGEAGDVDEELRRGEPHVERGDEALAAGEDSRARPLEQFVHLSERFRLGVGEGRCFQCASSNSVLST